MSAFSVGPALACCFLSFGCGWFSCLAWRDDRPPHDEPRWRRRLAEASTSSGLDELLGISPTVARSIRMEIEQHGGARARARWAEGSGAPDGRLVRHYKSKAYLQDAFVRLHNFLFAAHLLPLVDWGKGRGIDMQSPASAHIPTWLRNATIVGRGTGYAGYHAGPSVISRLAINSFVLAERDRVPAGATCLGWDTTEYTDLVPGCEPSKNWALVFKAGKVQVDATHRVLKADIASLGDASSLTTLGIPRFDLIICQEVFEHVQRPVDGARALYNLLTPGGRVFFTTPFNAQYGARVLLMDSGMDIEATYKIGNSAIASGFMLGFGAGDFDLGTIKKRLLQPVREPVGKSSSWGRMAESLYVGTCVVGRKPLRTR